MAPPTVLDATRSVEVRRLLALGYTTRSIAQAIGCAHNTIRLFAMKNDIPIGNAKKRHQEAARKLYLDEELSPLAIADKLNLQLATVLSYFHKDEEMKRVRRLRRAEANAAKANAAKAKATQSKMDDSPPLQEIEPSFNERWGFRPRPQRSRLPPIEPDLAQQLISQFITSRGVTKCPTMFVAPTTK